MKRIAHLILLVVFVLLLSSCKEMVTPVAYTRYDASGSEYADYTTSVYTTQLKVYESEADCIAQVTPLLEFNFIEGCGHDDLEGVTYALVDVTNRPVEMRVSINTESASYDSSKKIYLNNVEPSPDGDETIGTIKYLTFDSVDFVRTNPNGHIDTSAVNVLEYKE